MSCSTEIAAAVRAPSYKRATFRQVALAVVSEIAGVASWIRGGGAMWLAGAALIFSAMPFTLLAIMPTNKKLLAPDIDRASDATRALLQKWGRLHAVRSILSLAASIIFVVSI
jgi:uncharacterized membrane protein